jgi:hypothetical protein
MNYKKKNSLFKLAQKRQLTRWDGYSCIADLHGGVYECDYVSPYTKSASNVDAAVMLVLQDWASSEYFERHDGVISDLVELGYDSSVDTNINLKRLLKTHLNFDLQDTYATNLMPFIKQGGMSASIPMKVLVNAAIEFALPQVKIVQPKIVICFGLQTFNAMRRAYSEQQMNNMDDAINAHFSYELSTVFCQAHPGRLGQNNRNRGGVDRVSIDWKRMQKISDGKGGK